jgi:uncharacterized protein (DUF1800 family)
MNIDNLHILSRLGFGPKLEWLDDPQKSGLLTDKDYLVNWLFSEIPTFQDSETTFQNQRINHFGDISDTWRSRSPHDAQRMDWIMEMAIIDNPLREKAALFWSHHVPIRVSFWDFAQTLLLDIYRKNGLGEYKDLLVEISSTPCAMKFLNAYHSHKSKPNQNFPRELLEIFTLGVGNYNQFDIEEISRAFTGRRTVFPDIWDLPYPYKMYIEEDAFDPSDKNIFGQVGNWNGEDAIRIILEQPQCANHLAISILNFYLSDIPKKEHIDITADFLYQNKLNLFKTLKFIVQQSWFCDKIYVGNKVKTPIELWVKFLRQTKTKPITTETNYFMLREMGQDVLWPVNVGGWPKGKAWLKGSKLSNRVFLPSVMLEISEQSKEPITFVKKVYSKFVNSNLYGYQYEHKVIFNDSVLDNTLTTNNIHISDWLEVTGLPRTRQTGISQLLQHPKYQFH